MAKNLSDTEKRIRDAYGDDEPPEAFVVNVGTRVGSTSKNRLEKGLVDEL